MLQCLDLGDNRIKDTFPSWLGTLLNLKVLILRSNEFHCAIGTLESGLAFPELHIVDLSYNEFTVVLPLNCLKTWNAMKSLSAEPLKYMHATNILVYHLVYKYHNFYNYSMTFTNKGIIMEFALIANEVIDSLKKGNEGGFLLKVDFEKAYDSVDWRFLNFMMTNMGFGVRWRRWIGGCISNAKVSVLVNGVPTEPFKMRRGLDRDVCYPLSSST
ncbi:Reverse transcriptase domain - like 10 [Theobroma cacao]|nr:Reverse transcriptase domain - like 10 [Theobroma cacao]